MKHLTHRTRGALLNAGLKYLFIGLLCAGFTLAIMGEEGVAVFCLVCSLPVGLLIMYRSTDSYRYYD